MKQVIGSELSSEVQQEALAKFVHRYTRSHKPAWVTNSIRVLPMPFNSDAEWLAHTLFWINDDGELSKSRHWCESSPTWPDNPEFRPRVILQPGENN